MTTTITVSQNYGYVVLISVVAIPILGFTHGVVTGKERRAARCAYPNAYASAQEMKANRAAYRFNCAQRAHGNFLENAPQASAMMLVAGLVYPLTTVGLGVVWLVSRLLYLYGYVYSDRGDHGGGRRLGSGFWLAQAALCGLVALTAKKLISNSA